MKNFILIFLLLCFKGKAICFTDSLEIVKLNRLLQSQFTKVLTGQSNLGIGGFAAIETVAPKISVEFNKVTKRNIVLNLNLAGGVSDNFFAIFKNINLNNNFSGNLKINKVCKSSYEKFTYIDDNELELFDGKMKIKEKYWKDYYELESETNIENVAKEKDKYIKLCRTEKSKIDSLKSIYNEHILIDFHQNNLVNIDSLINNLNDKINFYSNKKQKKLNYLITTKEGEMEKLNFNVKFKEYNLNWIQAGYNLKNNNFNIYTPELLINDTIRTSLPEFEKNIIKKSNWNHEFTLQYANYKYSIIPGKTQYFNLGIKYSLIDNLTDLKKKELIDETKLIYEINNPINKQNPVQTITRIEQNRKSVYVGDFKPNFVTYLFYADLIKYFKTEKKLAYHIFPNFMFGDIKMYNIGFGLIFSVLNKKEPEKALLNNELYINFSNKFQGFNLKNNEIGLRFSLPINFNL